MRLPFALLGLGCVALLCAWLARAGASGRTWLLFALCLLGNVSLFLFFRNARYYGPAILCTVAAACLYLGYDGRRWKILVTALVLCALFASNYLNHAALLLCLGCDHLVWGRRTRRLGPVEWALFWIPQIVVCGAIFWRWNTLGTENGQLLFANGLAERLTLLGWTVRDMNACEFGAVGFLALAPVLYCRVRDPWLLRAACALALYVLFLGLAAPTPVALRASSDMRYLAPAIPLCIATSVLILRAIGRTRLAWTALPLAALLSGTNLLHGGPLLEAGLRSTPLAFASELWDPPGDPYRAAARWIEEHVAEGQSVFVLPEYMVYPLMFHAPRAVYAWQFTPPPRGALASLPPIHFRGGPRPDFIVAFGPQALEEVTRNLRSTPRADLSYERAATLPVYWRDRYRPEIMWRDFGPQHAFDPARQGIHVWRALAPR